MAARLGNSVNPMNLSMTEELFEMVRSEEYVDNIMIFEGTDYINKVELTALKKMMSGKLWIDNRKFVSRQNQSMTSGIFNLFGQTIGKSAFDVRTEACDFFLNVENKELREKFRRSFKLAKKSYSAWISNFNDENTPCNEFSLYLLCCTYKRHVVIVLSSKLWCSFKPGNMSTYEKLQKADHVLVWTGEDKFAEIKLLQVKSGVGNVLGWQHCAESIDHTHEKRLSTKVNRRPNKAMDTVKAKPKMKTASPVSSRRGTKRDSKVVIDYAQYHSAGILSSKSPKLEKPLPRASGPSEDRQAAQNMIIRQKRTPTKGVSSGPQRNLIVKRELPPTTEKTKTLVKPEPGIYMRH